MCSSAAQLPLPEQSLIAQQLGLLPYLSNRRQAAGAEREPARAGAAGIRAAGGAAGFRCEGRMAAERVWLPVAPVSAALVDVWNSCGA